jgi:hypothetical protein
MTSYETAAVTYLPLARTNDPHDRIVAKNQYNEWLTHHKLLPTPGQVKDYGINWEDAVREMQKKIKSSKNELHRLILSLYTGTPLAGLLITLKCRSMFQMTERHSKNVPSSENRETRNRGMMRRVPIRYPGKVYSWRAELPAWGKIQRTSISTFMESKLTCRKAKRQTYCANCANPDKHLRCIFKEKSFTCCEFTACKFKAEYSFEGQSPRLCEVHKLNGMKTKRCSVPQVLKFPSPQKLKK